MDMKEWAKREVELACKRENPDRKEGEFVYGCACYFPITMPYIPAEKPFTVYMWDFLADAENDDGGYDTIEVMNGVNPGGEKFGIHRYFKVTEDCDYVEIDCGEFLERYEQSNAKKERMKGE